MCTTCTTSVTSWYVLDQSSHNVLMYLYECFMGPFTAVIFIKIAIKSSLIRLHVRIFFSVSIFDFDFFVLCTCKQCAWPDILTRTPVHAWPTMTVWSLLCQALLVILFNTYPRYLMSRLHVHCEFSYIVRIRQCSNGYLIRWP